MGAHVSDEKYGKYKSAFELLTGTPMITGYLEEKIIGQKAAYILYKTGLRKFYTDFSWYLYGVFSWDLWHGMIHNLDEKKVELDKDAILKIDEIRNRCIDVGLNEYFSDSRKMELITTILYWAERDKLPLEENNEELISVAIQKKEERNFSREEVNKAISKLKEINWNFEN